MIIEKVNCTSKLHAHGIYRASLAGYLDKYANTHHEAIALMLAQVTYWNSLKK